MGISNRINDWVEERRKVWGDALGDFVLGSISKGIYKAIEDMEPGAVEAMHDTLARLRDNENLPPEIKSLIDGMITPGHPLVIVAGIILAVLMIIPMVLGLFQPLSRLLNYSEERIFKSGRLDPLTAIRARWRQIIGDIELNNTLADFGLNDEDKEALKKVSRFYPSAQDLITWIAKEVFEPEAIDRYGLGDEFGKLDLSLFEGAGVDATQALNYWIAHWEHASFIQVVEMLHRGLLTKGRGLPSEPNTAAEWKARDAEGEEAMYEWFRLVEIPPFWRPLLTEMSWNVPTRVDVRRFRDMRVISKEELYSIYHKQGYHGKELDFYVTWTEVYNEFPDLLARWKNGWITEDDVRSRLLELGMPADRVEEMIQEKVMPFGPARVAEGLTLTKAEIYKGVKQGVITKAEGIELLMDIGNNRAEAEYLIDINVESLTGSPQSFADFKQLTTQYKIAIGKEVIPMPEEIKQAAAEVVKLTDEVQILSDELAKFNAEVIDVEPLPENIWQQRTELEAKVADAEIQLTYAKTRYETELAKWRHSQ